MDRYQLRCPKDDRMEVVEVEQDRVTWCSRFLGHPDCDEACVRRKQGPTVLDLCRREVFTVDPEMSLAAVSRLFQRHRISGAPVVDRKGRLLGVISTTDLARTVDSDRLAELARGAGFYRSLWRHPEWEGDEGTLARQVMNDEIVSLPAGAAPAAAVRLMLERHIHRLLILDEKGQLAGILTTTDLLHRLHDLLR